MAHISLRERIILTWLTSVSQWLTLFWAGLKYPNTMIEIYHHSQCSWTRMVLLYPWTTQITFDRGSEFIGHAFKHMIMHGIKTKPIACSQEFTSKCYSGTGSLGDKKCHQDIWARNKLSRQRQSMERSACSHHVCSEVNIPCPSEESTWITSLWLQHDL